MIFLKIKNQDNETLINTFPDNISIPKQESDKNDRFRYHREKFDDCTLEIYIDGEKKITQNNKIFKQFFHILKVALKKIIESLNSKIDRTVKQKAHEMTDDYLHNIVKIHGNQKSIIERCVEGAEGQFSYDNYVEAVKNKIIQNPDDFANDICAFSKEVRLIEYHTAGYNLLHDTSSRVNITNNHNLKKLLLGLAHLFFADLKKNNVVLNLYNVDETFRSSFEYETFNIAMHCFLENIVKYAKPYTSVNIYTETETAKLIFDMNSVRIDKDEVKKIMERGAYGCHVPEALRGKGIGMYLLKTALDRSNISIDIRPNLSENSKLNEIDYTENKFILSFPKSNNFNLHF